MPTDNTSNTEGLIAEPLSVRLSIDRTSVQAVIPGKASGASQAVATPYIKGAPLPTEAQRIVDALQAICSAPDGTVFDWAGRKHKILKPHFANAGKDTQLIGYPGAERAAQIVIAPVERPEQHIFTKYAVVPNGKWVPGKPRFYLECEGNPTSLMVGNNVLPITFRDSKTKAIEPYPSSAPQMLTIKDQVLFHFLEDIAAQITGSESNLFEALTWQAIKNGDFSIVHIQWCCYFPADVSRFLQVLVALFAPVTATNVGVAILARQLGLSFEYVTDERSTRVKAAKFEERHGKNAVWSAVFYDKRSRVADVHQGKSLEDDERELIANNVRFDMTAHTIGVMQIITAAVDYLGKHRDQFAKLQNTKRHHEFIDGTPQPTARWLEYAVFILSHRLEQGRMQRGSFEDYLVPFFLDEVLQLPSIVCCTPEGLQALEELDQPLAKAWSEDKSREARGWVQRLATAANCTDHEVRKCQKEWLKTYGIDISIPHAYYRDLQLFPAITLMQDEEREAYYKARQRGDDKARLRVLDKASETLFSQMREFVGAPILTPPTLLRAKVVGERLLASDQPRRSVAGKSPPARSGKLTPPVVRQITSPSQQQVDGALPNSATAPTPPSSAELPVAQASTPQIVYYPKIIVRKSPNGLHNGVDKQSSLPDLRKALREVNAKLSGNLSERERTYYDGQDAQIERLIERREQITKQGKVTRHENNRAERLKRMGGPMSHRKIKPPEGFSNPSKK